MARRHISIAKQIAKIPEINDTFIKTLMIYLGTDSPEVIGFNLGLYSRFSSNDLSENKTKITLQLCEVGLRKNDTKDGKVIEPERRWLRFVLSYNAAKQVLDYTRPNTHKF